MRIRVLKVALPTIFLVGPINGIGAADRSVVTDHFAQLADLRRLLQVVPPVDHRHLQVQVVARRGQSTADEVLGWSETLGHCGVGTSFLQEHVVRVLRLEGRGRGNGQTWRSFHGRLQHATAEFLRGSSLALGSVLWLRGHVRQHLVSGLRRNAALVCQGEFVRVLACRERRRRSVAHHHDCWSLLVRLLPARREAA